LARVEVDVNEVLVTGDPWFELVLEVINLAELDVVAPCVLVDRVGTDG